MIWKFVVLLLVCSEFSYCFPAESSSELQNAENDDNSEEYKPEENLNNPKVTEGDILVDDSTRKILENLKSNARDAISNPVKHWPNGRVAYTFGSVSSRVRSAFRAAIADYHKYTCLRFVPRTTQRDYIYVVSEGGCWSPIGRSRGRQKLSLGRGCEHKGTAIHEIMHALGFFHEQSRIDRDRYVTIVWRNINSRMRYNFEKYRHGEADTLGASYDYKSVMHYPPKAFSINGQRTIIPKQSGVALLGQRSGFSKTDLYQVNKLYKCRGGVVPTQRPRPTRPRPQPPTRPPVVGCSDNSQYSSSCSGWAKKRYCLKSSRYYNFMKANCKKTCGHCGRPSSCRDNRGECYYWRSRGYCHYRRWYSFMTRECKKTCGRC